MQPQEVNQNTGDLAINVFSGEDRIYSRRLEKVIPQKLLTNKKWILSRTK
jgi:hypothetical protein